MSGYHYCIFIIDIFYFSTASCTATSSPLPLNSLNTLPLYLFTLADRLIAVEHAYRLKIDKEHTHTVTSASPSDPLSISTIITEIDSRDLRVKTNITTGGTSLMASEL